MPDQGFVLVVDDDAAKRYVIARLLRGAGHRVVETDTAADALELVQKRPDVMVLDVRLPDLSGLEVCRRIKADPATADVLVLALSASFTSNTHRVLGLDSGADSYLTYPLDDAVFLATVGALLRLRRSQEALEQASEFRELLLGVVGHDLRSPLAAISLISEKLLRRAGAAPEARDLRRIKESALRMGRMIEQLLDLTRGRLGGGIPIVPRQIDLGPVCRQVIGEMEGGNPERKVVQHLHGDLVGFFDEDRLAQVLANLLRNAAQHGATGTPIDVSVEGTDTEVTLAVHNQGAPIPAHLQAQLFDPFRRGRAEDEHRPDGLGLGLYIVRQIVDAHGGRIEVRSTAEDGTSFTVHLPRNAPQAPASPATP